MTKKLRELASHPLSAIAIASLEFGGFSGGQVSLALVV